jgi:prolyl oligopeptidase
MRSSSLFVLFLLSAHCGPEPGPRTATPPMPSTSASTVGATPAAVPAPKSDAPATAAKPVTDTYHGVAVVDPYRWLEDASSPDVKAWNDAQSAYSRKKLDALPGREKLRARFTELLGSASADYFALKSVGKKLFAIEDRPPKQQPFLVTLDSPTEEGKKNEKVVLDPERARSEREDDHRLVRAVA